MQRQGSRYTVEEKATALALARQSTASSAARELEFPESTVRRWVQHYSESGDNQWDEDNVDVIERSTEITMKGLEQLGGRDDIYKHLMALNAIRGTSIDKLQRGSNSSKNATFVVVRSSDGTTIEVGTQNG
ncbi:hypothetical protein LCGC14_1332000 [marine sediment metagenome]|uniref:Uncharacterized protein n=2 Tax=marine sediment metagenome TaxID=412755 RepID=A0A0F9NIN8_9ZZZZ